MTELQVSIEYRDRICSWKQMKNAANGCKIKVQKEHYRENMQSWERYKMENLPVEKFIFCSLRLTKINWKTKYEDCFMHRNICMHLENKLEMYHVLYYSIIGTNYQRRTSKKIEFNNTGHILPQNMTHPVLSPKATQIITKVACYSSEVHP